MTQHIVGTRMEDLSQIYNGRIVIKGSLSLQNLQLINADFNVSPFAPIDSDPSVTVPSAQIVVDGTPFDLRSISQLYWMKSLDQVSSNHSHRLVCGRFFEKTIFIYSSLEFR